MIDEAIFRRAQAVVLEWEGKENWNVPAHIVVEIFNTHNQVFPDKPENSRSCSGCRARVWNRLKTWYHENKHLYAI